MQPWLLVLTDTTRFPDPAAKLRSLLGALPPGSVGVVVRDRELPDSEWLRLAESIAVVTDDTQQRLIVADRIEHVTRLGAYGVHLRAEGASPASVRAQVSAPFISRSSRDLGELSAADRKALSALLVSPAFSPRKGQSALGQAGLKGEAEKLAPCPVFALGGVGAREIEAAFAAGASGVAMIGAAYSEPPERIADAILACVRQASSGA